MARLKLGVLISGRGSNLQAILDACADPAFPAEVALVISNVEGAGGLDRARAANVPVAVVPHRNYPDRPAFEAALTHELDERGVRLVCLAGFMRLLTRSFVDRWKDRIINIHPSLLPAFKGLDIHERVLAAGARITGCTVHYVRAEMDEGPIIVQGAVPVLAGDTPDTLAARVLTVEHRIYPLAVKLIAEGRARVVGDLVPLQGEGDDGVMLVSPER
ncbi:MAG: phosphoribosylglycinamide formyltransferase [Pseudomonadota bacterium]|nr:phosphoribosylglycinamide formyltransferase [Pseudomonadota bacterium]